MSRLLWGGRTRWYGCGRCGVKWASPFDAREDDHAVHGLTRAVILTVGIAVLFSPDAHAQLQALKGRISIHVNGAYQAGSEQFQDNLAFTTYGEQASFESTHDTDGGAFLDVGGSVRVWRRLAIGATYSELHRRDSTAVAGSLPHPLLFDRFREVGPQTLSLLRRERVTHIQAVWTIPLWERVDVALAGGPSFFNVRQGVVTSIDVSEVGPPFTSVNIDGIGSREYTANGVGVNIGAEITYMVTTHFGAGFFVRSVVASVDLPAPGGQIPLDAVQAGGGIRARF